MVDSAEYTITVTLQKYKIKQRDVITPAVFNIEFKVSCPESTEI